MALLAASPPIGPNFASRRPALLPIAFMIAVCTAGPAMAVLAASMIGPAGISAIVIAMLMASCFFASSASAAAFLASLTLWIAVSKSFRALNAWSTASCWISGSTSFSISICASGASNGLASGVANVVLGGAPCASSSGSASNRSSTWISTLPKPALRTCSSSLSRSAPGDSLLTMNLTRLASSSVSTTALPNRSSGTLRSSLSLPACFFSSANNFLGFNRLSSRITPSLSLVRPIAQLTGSCFERTSKGFSSAGDMMSSGVGPVFLPAMASPFSSPLRIGHPLSRMV